MFQLRPGVPESNKARVWSEGCVDWGGNDFRERAALGLEVAHLPPRGETRQWFNSRTAIAEECGFSWITHEQNLRRRARRDVLSLFGTAMAFVNSAISREGRLEGSDRARQAAINSVRRAATYLSTEGILRDSRPHS